MAKNKLKERIYIILYMIIITAFFTGVVSWVNELVKEGIAINKKNRELQGVLDVLNIKYDRENIILSADKYLKLIKTEDLFLYQGFNEDGKSIGYAFPISGSGFWGSISGYVAVTNRFNKIIDLTFISHNETPGLGARITEPWFLNQFKNKDITDYIAGKDKVKLVQKGNPKGKNDVDAVTGATGTSTAVQKIMNEAIANIKKYSQTMTER